MIRSSLARPNCHPRTLPRSTRFRMDTSIRNMIPDRNDVVIYDADDCIQHEEAV